MLPIEESFSLGFEAMAATWVGGVDLDEESELGVERAFFEEDRPIVIDLDKRLCCLLQNLALKLVVISSYSSFAQIIWGTSRLSPTFVSSLEKEDEEDDENGEAGDGVLAFWTGRVTSFFIWVGEQTTKLEARWLAAEVCLNILFWHFFSCSFRRAWRASESAKRATS